MKNKSKNKLEFSHFRYLSRYKALTFCAPFFKVIETICELIVPLIMAKIIDYGISHNDVNFIIWNGVLILGLNLIGFIFAVLSHKCAALLLFLSKFFMQIMKKDLQLLN